MVICISKLYNDIYDDDDTDALCMGEVYGTDDNYNRCKDDDNNPDTAASKNVSTEDAAPSDADYDKRVVENDAASKNVASLA